MHGDRNAGTHNDYGVWKLEYDQILKTYSYAYVSYVCCFTEAIPLPPTTIVSTSEFGIINYASTISTHDTSMLDVY